jgi:multiple sugar transport system ATP-binding protein
MAAILLTALTKIYDGRTRAVADLSLSVDDGELLVVVGPSGCGKTTTLRLIAGLERPTSGVIRIDGAIVNDVPARQRDVAMVFQDGSLYPHMTVYENLAFPLRMRKQSKAQIERQVQSVAAMLEFRDLLRRRPATLSGGQRQRVALGRAVVREPTVFLLDEPLAHLDARSRASLRVRIKRLHAKLGVTTLHVTHDQSEAMALGGRIAVLRAGRVQQVGSPGRIYDRPANRFVAGFFGNPPMNFLDARLESDGPIVCATFAGASLPLSPQSVDALRNAKADAVVVGVRPHDLSMQQEAASAANTLRGRVVLVESLGSRADVHVELAQGGRCIVSTPPDRAPIAGEKVHLAVDAARLHIFEPGPDGASLLTSATAGN